MSFRLPNTTQRVAIMGRTGSGKTVCAAWLLSHAAYKIQPYIIFDFKRDKLLGKVDAKEITFKTRLPEKPGLYIIHPTVGEEERVEELLWKIWEKENVGVYIDEAYMIPKSSQSFQALLTQGRSKHIPVIALTQRPAWISRFLFSESDFLCAFHLNDARDRQSAQQFLPADLETRLPDYHSHWYDVGQNKTYTLRPVPDEGTILASIGRKTQRKTLL